MFVASASLVLLKMRLAKFFNEPKAPPEAGDIGAGVEFDDC